ncbi:MAG: hypothetical protein AAF214_03750 [Pseudomonadota bacterium]
MHWFRAFPCMDERKKLKASFYEGSVWTSHIEPIAMSMIDHMDAELTETTADFQTFTGTHELL